MGGAPAPEHPPVFSERKGRNLKSDVDVIEQLRQVTAGIWVMSESDYPFEVIKWEGSQEITSDFLRNLTDANAGSAVEELQLETFLEGEKYKNVVKALKKNLSGIRVYKVGRINIPVYIVGKSDEGNWLGLSTRLVQT
jgi:hypothetical protein